MVTSIVKDLLSRRVPQILGIYLAISWGIVEFVGFLADNYPVSPHLMTFALVGLASMVPTVLLLAYFHGKPGADGWARTEKIGIPANLLASVALLFFVFSGKDLGATTTTLTLENEEGETIERVVPKSEFRKNGGLFFFDNESGDSTLNWLQMGFTLLLWMDLDQDLYINLQFQDAFYEKLKRAGFPEGLGLPLALKRDLAEELHLRYFVAGSFTSENDHLSVKIAPYETGRARPLAERTFTGSDVFAIVDSMSVQLKHDLGIPTYHIEEVEDRPVSEVLTSSLTALELTVDGWYAIAFRNPPDYESAFTYFEAAVAEDPTYARVHWGLANFYYGFNQFEKAVAALEAARQHKYMLPQREQFEVNYFYYSRVKQDPDRALATVKMWAEVFPDDIDAHDRLAGLYSDRRQWDEAIEEKKRILELDPERYDHLRTIGWYYRRKGEFSEALEYYRQYAEQFPDDYRSFREIGWVHGVMGDHDQAKANYEKALLIEPDNVSVTLDLGGSEGNLGNSERALEYYTEGLRISTTANDSAAAYWRLRSFYEARGQLGKAIEHMHLAWAERDKQDGPLDRAVMRLNSVGTYAAAGRQELAFQVIDSIGTQLPPPWDRFPPLAYLRVYVELEDADNAQRALDEFEPFIEVSAFEGYRNWIFYAQGRIHEMRGEYEQALQSYEKWLDFDPTAWFTHRRIGRCYRFLQDFAKAEEYVKRTLELAPFSPLARYEMALVYADMGDREKALEHLEVALSIWKEADPEFKLAQEARQKLAQITSAS